MIKIAFTGDIMLARRVGQEIRTNSETWQILTPEIQHKLRSYDYVVGNLECPVAVSARRLSDTSFKANPDTLKQLFAFDLLTTANNHIFDCGLTGVEETLENISKYNFDTSGVFSENIETNLVIKKIADKTFGFVAAATNSCINKENSYQQYIIDAESETFLNDISFESKKVDHLFVLIHGGNEMIAFPEPSFRKLCQNIIENGATAVITHHPHVLGGFEIFKDRPIIYSLGDFIFDGQSYKRRRGAILEFVIDESAVKFNLVPTQISKTLQVSFADRKTSEIILTKWKNVSHKLTDLNYNSNYKKLYMSELRQFQTDRLMFLLKNEGVFATLKFMFNKMILIKIYANRILKGNIN